MNTGEVKAAVKSLGWTLVQKKDRYFYAVKRINGKRTERYLFSISALASKTQADIWQKLL